MPAFGGNTEAVHEKITTSLAELSLVTRAFFFTYLGVIFRWPGGAEKVRLGSLL